MAVANVVAATFAVAVDVPRCFADGSIMASERLFSKAESGTPSKDAFLSKALGNRRRRDELSVDIFFIL